MSLALDLGVLVATFAIIFPAELPDKSFIATLVLATRYPRPWVWLGATLAFVNLILSGELPRHDSLLESSLIGLRKPDGGVRPIAIGEV